MRLSRRKLLIAAGAAAAGGALGRTGPSTATEATPRARLLTTTPRQNELVEFRVDGVPLPGAGQNPFDPAQFDVPVRYVGPGGRELVTTAFWHESDTWRARLLAEVPGRWRAYVDNGAPVTVHVARSPTPGVVRRRDSQLVYPDGKPYLALGENLAWSVGDVADDYQQWYAALGEVGATWSRLWMSSWAFGLEWNDTPLGDYRARLGRAGLLDAVLALGEAQGVRAHLVLQNHGAFSTTFNSEWASNPYNAALGGPLATPEQLWTDATATELFRRRYRYAVSRWWAHPGLLAWELFNEFDLMEYRQEVPAAVAWHREMATYLRDLDPLRRPITTSLSVLGVLAPNAGYDEVWAVPDIDIVQAHVYGSDAAPTDLLPALSIAATRLRAHGKPFLHGETDTHSAPAHEWDPTGEHLVDLVWGGLFTSAAGSAMPWWWDNYVDRRDLYHRFAGGFRFAGTNTDVIAGAEPATESADSSIRPLTVHHLRNGDRGAMWIRNAQHTWFSPDDTTVSDATVRVPGSRPTAVQFWNVSTGEPTGPETVLDTAASTTTVSVPAFSRSIALTYRHPRRTPRSG